MAALGDPQAPALTPAERAALRFAEGMTRDAHGVGEAIFAELHRHFDAGQVVEIATVAGLFNYFNRFNNALQVEITA